MAGELPTMIDCLSAHITGSIRQFLVDILRRDDSSVALYNVKKVFVKRIECAMKMNVISSQLSQLLKKQNRSLYWLAKETGVSYQSLWKLNKDRTERITFLTLDKICSALKCKPGEVLINSPEK